VTPRESLGELAVRIKRAKLYLPPIIALFVLLFQLGIRHSLDDPHAFWLMLAFYGLLGPFVVYLTLDWVADELSARERAERELLEANRRLQAVRQVVHRALEAESLDEVMRAVAEAIRATLGGEVAITLGEYRYATAGFPFNDCDVEGLIKVDLGRSGGQLCFFGEVDRGFLEVLAGEVDSVLEAAEARTRDLLTLFEVDEALRAEANLEKLLGRLLERIVAWAGAEGGAVYLLDEGGVLKLWAYRGEPPEKRAFIPKGAWAEGLKKPVFLAPGRLLIPLGDKTPVGVLLLIGDHEKLRSELAFLRLLASQVTLAVRNAQAYLRAEELAIHEERTRIAREIHDGLAQSLAFMALKLDLTDRMLERDPKRAKSELAQVREVLREQIREVRRSIFALRPIDLERYGFVESVRRYTQAFAEQAGFRAEVEVKGKPELTQASELALFRVLQEALNNVAKHARARRVRVVLEPLGPKGARLVVEDDGVGFDPETAPTEGHFGLAQMRERVAARGGERPGQGDAGRRRGAGVTGAVLAGGRSRRFGSDKAYYRWRGRPLYAHALFALSEAKERFLVAPRNYPVPTRPDLFPNEGPLGGLVSALAAAGSELVAVAPVDAPGLCPAFWRFLFSELGSAPAVVVEGEPLIGVWRRSLFPFALKLFLSGERRAGALVAALPVRLLSRELVVARFGAEALVNLNRPPDKAMTKAG